MMKLPFIIIDYPWLLRDLLLLFPDAIDLTSNVTSSTVLDPDVYKTPLSVLFHLCDSLNRNSRHSC